MTTLKQKTGRVLALVLAGAALASCMAHGGPVRDIGIDTHPNYVSHNKAFYDRLLSGRAWILEGVYHPNYRNIVRGFVFAKDGSRIGCLAYKKTNGDPLWLAQRGVKWEVTAKAKLVGAVVRNTYDDGRKVRHLPLFYDLSTGALAGEIVRHEKSGRQYWIRSSLGHVQDTWPRALADACPGLVDELPAGMAINEKQTSLRMDELRRQDPAAPIRNFPGSHLTSPGRTGLGASRAAPTTTKEEVLAFIRAQNGNVVRSASEAGYVLVAGQALAEGGVWTDEVWRLDDEGRLAAYGVLRAETDAAGQDWIVAESPGYPEFRYLVGYPFPVLPTGHRHAAFQLSDHLIGSGKPHPLHFMGEAYADSRFVFTGNGLLSVVDRQGELAAGEGFEGTWRWTQGRLEIRIAGDGKPRSIAWQDLAAELGLTPAVWTPSTPDRH